MKILLVEDKPSDARLIKEAFSINMIDCVFDVIDNGEDAIEYFHRNGPDEAFCKPDIILLDIKLPKKSGHEVLKDIKGSNDLKDIPVIMFTNSDSRNDITESYEHRANCYITKPFHVSEFADIVKYINDLWLKSK